MQKETQVKQLNLPLKGDLGTKLDFLVGDMRKSGVITRLSRQQALTFLIENAYEKRSGKAS